jgi:hypothetical protein
LLDIVNAASSVVRSVVAPRAEFVPRSANVDGRFTESADVDGLFTGLANVDGRFTKSADVDGTFYRIGQR